MGNLLIFFLIYILIGVGGKLYTSTLLNKTSGGEKYCEENKAGVGENRGRVLFHIE